MPVVLELAENRYSVFRNGWGLSSNEKNHWLFSFNSKERMQICDSRCGKFQPLTTFAKRSILKVWQGSECASEDCLQIQFRRRSEGSRFNNSSGKVEQNQQLNNTCYRIRNGCSEWKFTYKLNVDFSFQSVSQSVGRPAKQSVSQSVSQSVNG